MVVVAYNQIILAGTKALHPLVSVLNTVRLLSARSQRQCDAIWSNCNLAILMGKRSLRLALNNSFLTKAFTADLKPASCELIPAQPPLAWQQQARAFEQQSVAEASVLAMGDIWLDCTCRGGNEICG